jgi:hypothetical protein
MRGSFLVSIRIGEAVEDSVGDILSNSGNEVVTPAFKFFAVQFTVHVLGDNPGDDSSRNSLIVDVVFELCLQ